MLIKAGLRKVAAFSPLLWRPVHLSKPASRLWPEKPNYYSTTAAADDGTSLDYSNLKPVDLEFIKFDAKRPASKPPVLVLHGLFVSFDLFTL